MMAIFTRALLAAATMASLTLAATPAARTAPDQVSIGYAVLWSVLGVCTDSVTGGYDFNDTGKLAAFGLEPAADEADLRSSYPGMEAARGSFPHGDILVGQASGLPCMVLVSGSERIAARDRLLAYLDRDGGQPNRESGADYEAVTYYFTDTTIIVQTKNLGTVNIAVKRPE